MNMSCNRISVRKLLMENIAKSSQVLQQIQLHQRVDSSDDFVPITTFMIPTSRIFLREMEIDEDLDVGLMLYTLQPGKEVTLLQN